MELEFQSFNFLHHRSLDWIKNVYESSHTKQLPAALDLSCLVHLHLYLLWAENWSPNLSWKMYNQWQQVHLMKRSSMKRHGWQQYITAYMWILIQKRHFIYVVFILCCKIRCCWTTRNVHWIPSTTFQWEGSHSGNDSAWNRTGEKKQLSTLTHTKFLCW